MAAAIEFHTDAIIVDICAKMNRSLELRLSHDDMIMRSLQLHDENFRSESEGAMERVLGLVLVEPATRFLPSDRTKLTAHNCDILQAIFLRGLALPHLGLREWCHH